MLMWPYQSPRRGASSFKRQFGEFDACDGGWELEGEPYTRAPGTTFDWWRARMLGGRTNHWGRISLRFGPDDFRGKTLDALGDDWPISYDEVAPYYDRVDRLIGIFGSREGLRNHPDGDFLPAPKPRCYELMIKQAADRLGVTCIANRLSILTRPLNGRAPCHYCGQCNRGCATNSNFSSPSVLIAPALETGRLTLITGAMAREVNVGRDGRATGVTYVDKADGSEKQVTARVVVLAASACESARLLLNSKSSAFPQGLANSSGTVGRYLTDTTGTGVSGFIPRMVDHVPHNEDGVGGAHLYMPWWLDNRRLDFPRGYHIEIGGGITSAPGYGVLGGIQRFPGGGGYGKQLKDDYRRYYGATVNFAGRGEMVPNAKSYCEIDPSAVDRWGIPVLRFHWEWSDHEYNQVKHMQETFRALIAEMGGTPMSSMPSREQGYGIAAGGRIIHEMGTTRMGSDPSTSVLNRNCQAHDVRNLFVTDGGPFVSQADKNPTWTILALAWKTSDYITAQTEAGGTMSEMNRREALTLIALAPFATAAGASLPEAKPLAAQTAPVPAQVPQERKFFTAHEWALATVLADLIIPADERSGAASSAGTIEFMDFMLMDETTSEATRVQVRGGLAWLDTESRRRFQRPFLEVAEAERTAILDDIAWPARARPEFSHGVAFFNRFRDLVASGFWSSQVGVRDLQYLGNVPVPVWNGCPPEALRKLGVSYEA